MIKVIFGDSGIEIKYRKAGGDIRKFDYSDVIKTTGEVIRFKIPKKKKGFRTLYNPEKITFELPNDIIELDYKELLIATKNAIYEEYKGNISPYVSAVKYRGIPYVARDVWDFPVKGTVDFRDFFHKMKFPDVPYVNLYWSDKENKYKIGNVIDSPLVRSSYFTPMGFNTSPLCCAISVSEKLNTVVRILASAGIVCRLYVDDFIIGAPTPMEVKQAFKVIEEIFDGYALHKHKVFRRGSQQPLLGTTSSNGLPIRLKKRERMKIRAALHNVISGKEELTKRKLNELKGYVAWATMISDQKTDFFKQQLKIVEQMYK